MKAKLGDHHKEKLETGKYRMVGDWDDDSDEESVDMDDNRKYVVTIF